ncbi:MAG: fibronectin type III domain-containing protein, partial [Chloroflexota bacterium]
YQSIDNAGNEEAIQTVAVQIDDQPPVSTLILTPPAPAGEWYSQTVTIEITATDDLSGYAGDSWYRLNGGALQSGRIIALALDGVHTLDYYSRDVAGNTEATRSASPVCRIDRLAPTVTATPDKVGDYLKPPVTIALNAQDDGSGVAVGGVEYRRQGAPAWTTGASFLVDGSGGDGVYTFEYRARDVANNVSPVQTVSVSIDGTPPGQATNLVASPARWTNQNGAFGLTWTSPPDFAGIGGVYYQIGIDPSVTLTPTFVAGEGISALGNLAVRGEGEHAIYIWLQDRAGNASVFSAKALLKAFRYDTTAPTCDAAASGTLGDDPQYYRGPVQITLAGQDGRSGLTAFHYRVDTGAWLTQTVAGAPASAQYAFSVTQQGRHAVSYRASDTAGNLSPEQSTTIRIDTVAPPAPSSVSGQPSAWTNVNNYQVCWVGTDDYSGIGSVYLKRGAAPANARDYYHTETVSLGQTCIGGVTLLQDGPTALYLWLKDRAGNVDYRTAQAVTLRLDTAAPTSSHLVTGTLGKNGYYVSPVALRLQANDGAAGAVSGVSKIYYRLNGGTATEWSGADVAVSREGEQEIEYWSLDVAGNEERPHKRTLVKLDLSAPSCKLWVASDYAMPASVGVSWQGVDTPNVSGVAKYAVEYRVGGCGPWKAWLAGTASTSQLFSGLTANNYHYFRARAEDNAGKVSGWSPVDSLSSVYVEGLGNPDFELGR